MTPSPHGSVAAAAAERSIHIMNSSKAGPSRKHCSRVMRTAFGLVSMMVEDSER